jgi:uncharacterized cupin superfamily protein
VSVIRRSIRDYLPIDVFNLFAEQDWELGNQRPGYRHSRTVIGERLGATLLGGSLYELSPGEKTWPYHDETGCEEWLIAVSGRPALRGPDGERELTPGDVAVVPEDPAGGHQVINRSDGLCRVLLLSSKSPLAVVHYPDSGKVGLWTQAEGYQAMLKTEPKLDYWGRGDLDPGSSKASAHHSGALRRRIETRCRVTPKRSAICSIVRPSA